MKIDVHNHVMPERALDLLRTDDVYGVTLTGRHWHGGLHVDFEIADAFTDPEAKLSQLESKGLDAAVVSVTPPLFYYHVDTAPGRAMARAVNDGLAEFCAAAPDRLWWLASLPMQDVTAACSELERAAELGCVGVEIGTFAGIGGWLDEPVYDPFWELAARLGLPVTLHPAYGDEKPALGRFYFENVLGFPFDTTVAIERLIAARVLDRHPTLQIVLLHGGGYFPYQAGRLRHARTVRPELAEAPEDPFAYLPQLWFDIITHDPVALRYLIERVGSDRVVVGTDLPFDMATPDPLALLDGAADGKTAATIAERNPLRLYGDRIQGA